jgi:tetratricopeptide (TPR) repeat protein
LAEVYEKIGNLPAALGHLSNALKRPQKFIAEDYGRLIRCLTQLDLTERLEQQLSQLLELVYKITPKERLELLEAMPAFGREFAQSKTKHKPWAASLLRFTLQLQTICAGEAKEPKAGAHLEEGISSSHLLLYYVESLESHLNQAVEHAKRAIELGNGGPGRYNLSCAYALLGRRNEAIRELRQLNKQELAFSRPDKDRDWERYWKDEEFREILKATKIAKRRRRAVAS